MKRCQSELERGLRVRVLGRGVLACSCWPGRRVSRECRVVEVGRWKVVGVGVVCVGDAGG